MSVTTFSRPPHTSPTLKFSGSSVSIPVEGSCPVLNNSSSLIPANHATASMAVFPHDSFSTISRMNSTTFPSTVAPNMTRTTTTVTDDVQAGSATSLWQSAVSSMEKKGCTDLSVANKPYPFSTTTTEPPAPTETGRAPHTKPSLFKVVAATGSTTAALVSNLGSGSKTSTTEEKTKDLTAIPKRKQQQGKKTKQNPFNAHQTNTRGTQGKRRLTPKGRRLQTAKLRLAR